MILATASLTDPSLSVLHFAHCSHETGFLLDLEVCEAHSLLGPSSCYSSGIEQSSELLTPGFQTYMRLLQRHFPYHLT